jgi:hypothetical protein
MDYLLRIGSRLVSKLGLTVLVLVIAAVLFATVAGLSPEGREELLYKAQDYLPIAMFLTLAVLLFSGYPVAFILGGIALSFGLIGSFLGVFKIIEFWSRCPRSSSWAS